MSNYPMVNEINRLVGDLLAEGGEVFLPERGIFLQGQPLQGDVMEILATGGIKALFRSRLQRDSAGKEYPYDER